MTVAISTIPKTSKFFSDNLDMDQLNSFLAIKRKKKRCNFRNYFRNENLAIYFRKLSTVSPLLDFMANFSIFHRFLIIPKEVCLTLIETFQNRVYFIHVFSYFSISYIHFHLIH